MPSRADLAIYQGDDYTGIVQVYDGNTMTKPADLTGYGARAQIRFGPADQYPSPAVIISTSVDGAAGTVALSIPGYQTLTLVGAYVWDLELIQPDGNIQTVLTGNVAVTREVTRAPGTPCNH